MLPPLFRVGKVPLLMAAKRGNIVSPARWSLFTAALEFDCHEDTLNRKLKQINEVPDADGCYGTLAISKALYGGLSYEKEREVRLRADHWAIRNKFLRAEVLDKSALEAGLSGIFTAVTRIIQASPLPAPSRNDIMSALGRIEVVVKEVGDRQSKQTGLKTNGDGEAEPNGDEEAGTENSPSQHKARRAKTRLRRS